MKEIDYFYCVTFFSEVTQGIAAKSYLLYRDFEVEQISFCGPSLVSSQQFEPS